jgi:hypothetical protein
LAIGHKGIFIKLHLIGLLFCLLLRFGGRLVFGLFVVLFIVLFILVVVQVIECIVLIGFVNVWGIDQIGFNAFGITLNNFAFDFGYDSVNEFEQLCVFNFPVDKI